MSRVFVAYQTPIADLRPFLARDLTRQLAWPHWGGLREGQAEFLRGMGAMRRRRRGGVGAWTGEELFCDARRAVRFPAAEGPWDLRHAYGAELGRLRLSWQFRRLYAGGVRDIRPIMRVDLGFRQTSPNEELQLTGEALRRLPGKLLASRLEVRPVSGPPRPDAWSATSLVKSGDLLAKVVHRATTDHRAPATPAGWVVPGRGMMIIEYPRLDLAAPPPRSRGIALVGAPGISLNHIQLDVGNHHPTIWFVGTEPATNQDVVRRLRLHLARIHAEHECLRAVVDALLDGALMHTEGILLRALEVYLDRAGSLLLSSERNGLRQDEILDVAYKTDAVVSEGELSTLLERLDAARSSVKDKLEAISM